MIQLEVYCDHCKEKIGEQKHLSMTFSMNGKCGVAVPPKDGTKRWWVQKFPETFIHLHGKCASPYFNALIKSAKNPEPDW